MIRKLRLFSGLVMLAYVTMHLLNHALGLVSIPAMGRVLADVFPIWSSPPAQAALYGSFLVHYVAGAVGAVAAAHLAAARQASWPQIVLGFPIPILLVRHVVGTRDRRQISSAPTPTITPMCFGSISFSRRGTACCRW